MRFYIFNGSLYAGAYSELNGFQGNWLSHPISVNTWYSVVFVFSNSGDMELYIDGTSVATSTGGTAIATHTASIGIGGMIQASKFHDIGDEAGNGNNAATQFVWTCDRENPTVTIASTTAGVTSGSTTNDASIDLTFTLRELNTTFEERDIIVTGGLLNGTFTGSGDTYTATFTPTLADSDSDGNPDSNAVECTVTVEPGTYQDAGGNNNTAGSFTWTCDRRLPVVTEVTRSADGYYINSIYFDVIFDELVTVSGSPTLTLTNGLIATAVSNDILSPDTVRFEYSATSDEHYTDVSIPDTSSIDLNGGSIKDAYNNDAVLNVLETSTPPNDRLSKRPP